MEFQIHQQHTLNIPSASGLVKQGEFYYVLGDDSPFLYQLNSKFELVERIVLRPGEQREPIPKPEKPDFEALEMITKDEMVGFGSGSLSPQRDSMIWIRTGKDTGVKTYSLTALYSDLKGLEIMKGRELNIEAAAFHEDQLHLFNRGKNVIFSFSFSKFLTALQSGSQFPEIKTSALKLPEIQGLEAGFSGAAVTTSGRLIVTCSVENTPNAYDDGEVLGSFVGVSSAVHNDITKGFSWTQITSAAPLKVESVIVECEISETELELVMVTDSDGAESQLLKGRLIF